MITKSNPHSQFRGVSWHKKSKKWVASIKVNNINQHLGYFDNERDAAEAYDKAKIERRMFEGLNFHHYKELQEDTSMAALSAIAAASIVTGTGAAATLGSDLGSSSRSTSKYIGVNYNKKSKAWVARITVKGVTTHLGHFDNEEDAALAYGLAKQSLTKERGEPTDLWSHFKNKDKFDNLLTVCLCYTSDVLVRTNIPFYKYHHDHYHYYDILLYCCTYITLSAAHCSNVLK
jgi:hypothetical protein